MSLRITWQDVESLKRFDNALKILAVAPVDVDDTSSANAIDARETMSSQRLIPIDVAAKVYED